MLQYAYYKVPKKFIFTYIFIHRDMKAADDQTKSRIKIEEVLKEQKQETKYKKYISNNYYQMK